MIVTVWYAKKMKIMNIFTLVVHITKHIGKRPSEKNDNKSIRYGHSMGFSFNCDSNNIVYTSLFFYLFNSIFYWKEHIRGVIQKHKLIHYNNMTYMWMIWTYRHIHFISEYKIIVKLRNKENWISELNILKKAIPKQWKDIIMSQDSIKTQVIPQKYIKIPNNQIQNLQMNMPVCSNHPHVCQFWYPVLFVS
jgi:hypothetical protein